MMELSTAEKAFLLKFVAATLRQLNTRLDGDRRSLESMTEITPASPAIDGWKRMMESTKHDLDVCNGIWHKLVPSRSAPFK